MSSAEGEEELIDLMRMCWEEIPAFRPNFYTIRDSIKKMNKGKYVHEIANICSIDVINSMIL